MFSPTIAKITDFLLFLHKESNLSVASVHGFRAALSSVFKSIFLKFAIALSFGEGPCLFAQWSL